MLYLYHRLRISVFILFFIVAFQVEAQIPDELRPSDQAEHDLATKSNLLQLKSGSKAAFRLDKGIREYRGSSRWAIGYERTLGNDLLENWWSFKTDARVYDFNSGKVESRMMLTHSRQMNEFIQMRSNWGLGYGAGIYPTYMMGLTFDLTKQWHLLPRGKLVLPKLNYKSKSKNQSTN